MESADVRILMGSDSDLEQLQDAVRILKEFKVSHEIRILSAHRTPRELTAYLEQAEKDGARVYIAAAGGSAHLAGVIAAHTSKPVLAVPMPSVLNGLDSLLSTVQMPGGVPVATFSIGKAGGKNAALFAVQILALSTPRLAAELASYRRKMAEQVVQKDAAVRRRRPSVQD
ncbi:MAG: 5-(carboxyamino)imidazole ribonucleotide mutase [Planctomycetes bacterium]|nr:5-(carboxyamino)imidazole ribonucleotide mutase [Planctomycetota bacterium]